IMLGLLGYVAANPAVGVKVTQNQLAGFGAVVELLPLSGVVAFTAMVLAGLVAAGSAALTAVSSIGAVDVYRFFNPNASDRQLLVASRTAIVVLSVVGMTVALIPNIQLLYLVLLVGAFRASLLVPTILALYCPKLSPAFTFWGIISGIAVGVPLFVYGSIVKVPTIVSFGSLIPIVITTVACLGGSFLRQERFDYFRLRPKAEVSRT
ncbi:MAG: hypothetical protein Q8Q86_00180, partial [Candidatus Daviesbacteria bacterium]|nr:hypothetical protein [Candidatus Daviesbacteria bacterium]